MAAHLHLLFQYSSSSFLPLSQITRDGSAPNSLSPMQTPDVVVDDDDSWEVRAFAEDTADVMGTTWPPRSYTCTFCRREFRSAQALGGHMNVHRRDRARLHQAPSNAIKPFSSSSSSSSSTSNSFIIPAHDFNGGGLCVLYPFPNPYNIRSPSSLFSMSHRSFNNFIPSTSPASAFPIRNHRAGASSFPQSLSDEQAMESSNQEVDLELRLGQAPSTQTLMEKGHKISNFEAACLRKRSSDWSICKPISFLFFFFF